MTEDHHSDEHDDHSDEDEHDSHDHEDHIDFELNTTYYVMAWIKTISFIVIVVPFVIYCLRIMWKDRNKPYVKKRRPSIILILTILNLFIDFRMSQIYRISCTIYLMVRYIYLICFMYKIH